jgi:type VI secretion system protein ImpE
MTASELFQSGQLTAALAAAQADVKARPSDVRARSFFCELLCFGGEFERADKQLDALSDLDMNAALGVSQFRQLLRGELWRQQFYREGRPPELVAELSEEFQLRLEASLLIREQDFPSAAEKLRTAESLRQECRAVCNGKECSDIRDLDDQLGSILEVLTSTGKYYWVPWPQVASLEFQPARHARDQIWRAADIIVRDGPQGEVFIPVLYPNRAGAADEKIRLGRATDWIDLDQGIALGSGQRMLLVDDDALPVMQLASVECGSPSTEPA